ncbi:MAG: Signal transduction histidine kinase [Rhodospirillales bacterium]|nr:Signal transduction histidine kinase [Rhodospirillales bacterium]
MIQDAVVETSPEQIPVPADRELQYRLRQQELLAQLGVLALQRADFDELLHAAARLVAEGLLCRYCKVLELLPQERKLLVRAGVGWGAGVVGVAKIGADLDSPAGFALHTGLPVISNHLEHEQRFRTPTLLVEHGIRRAMNVILQGDGAPFGVLEVDSRDGDEFHDLDLAFLQGAANILGMAIERRNYQQALELSVARQDLLLHEVNHRVKNSLQLVASLLNLQATATASDDVRDALHEASARIVAIALVHDRIYKTDDVRTVDLGEYLRDLGQSVAAAASQCHVHIEAAPGLFIETDRAIWVAVIVNELVTNAAKHAYPAGADCVVDIKLTRMEDQMLELRLADHGRGLPEGFDPGRSSGLGMRVVTALARQLDASFELRGPGTQIMLRFPARVHD